MSTQKPHPMPEMADPKRDDEEEHGITDRLLETRTVLMSGTVNDVMARRIIQSLLVLEGESTEKPITLMINSGGGSVTAGFSIHDMIRFLRAPVRCVAAGLTASIATIVLIAAKKENRLALPNARLLIHQPLIPFNIFGPASDLEITASELVKTRAKINGMLAEACGKPLAQVEKDTARDFWMGAQEALEYGLVGRLVKSRADL